MDGMTNLDLVTRPDSLARSPNLVTTALAKAEALTDYAIKVMDANVRQDEGADDDE